MKRASAEIQLPAFLIPTSPEKKEPTLALGANWGEVTIILCAICLMSQSAAAPEKMRMKVKVAASTVVCFSAARQSSELLAKAIIARSVSTKSRVDFTTEELRIELFAEKEV